MADHELPPESEEDKKKLQEKLGRYAPTTTEDIICYVVLILGLLFLFFVPWVGGALLGVIFGVYFADESIEFFRNINRFIERQGIVRSLVICGTLVGFFILNPTFFIAAAIGVGIRQILNAFRKKS